VVSVTLEESLALRLYREHGAALRAYLRGKLGDAGVAEDVCQETFAAAIAQGVPGEGAARWLFAVARNQAHKHLRDRKPAAALIEAPAAEPGPVEALGEAERRARVRAAVAGLEPDLREAVQLRYAGGLTYPQIAERLEVPVSTVQGRLKRARQALRAVLGPEASS
jgi:RNA polymerase sigma-70 factor (ECF subfamily)